MAIAPPDWKPVSAVWNGGTREAQALKGRRVRWDQSVQGLPVRDPASVAREPRRTNVARGTLGFVATAEGDVIRIAIPRVPMSEAMTTTLEAVTRSGQLTVVEVNWPTFRMQFSIQVNRRS